MRLDGGAWIPSTSPKVYSGLSDNPHTFDVRATDAAGNTDLSPATFAWTVDTTAPNTTITGNPASLTNANSATFSFTSSEGASTFECRLEGGSWGSCTTPSFYGSLAEGSHTFDVRATDAAANTDATPATFTWSIDLTSPTGSMTSPADGARVRATILLASNSADGGSGLASVVFERSPAGAGTWTATPASWDTTLLSDGDYDLRVVTSDAAGNVTVSGVITVTVDNTPPNTNITSQPADPTNATGASFAFSSEAGATFEARLDGGAWSPSASPQSYSGLTEGSHTFQVRATDLAGNVDATPATFTWTVDTTAPNTNITSQPADPTNLTGASFAFTSSEGGSSFEVRIDSGVWSPSTSPKTYSGLTEGSHTFQVRATDPAGNQDATQASYTWTVDTTAPNSSFTSTPANPSSDTTPTFGFASTEAPATYEVNLDGGGWVSASTPLTISPALADGSHTLQLRASDIVGNQDATAAAYTWLVDNTNPTGSVTSPADGADVAGTVSLTSNSADAGSGVATVTFQSSPAGTNTWTNLAASWNTALELDGDYDLRVVTTDNAGNTFTSATITVTVDNTVPTLSVNVANPVNAATSDPTPLAATATDDGQRHRERQLRAVHRRKRRLLRGRHVDVTRRRHDSPVRRLLGDPGRRNPPPPRARHRQRRPPDGRARPDDRRPDAPDRLGDRPGRRREPARRHRRTERRPPPTPHRGRSTRSPSSARPQAPVRGPTSRSMRRRRTTRRSTRPGSPTASTTCVSSRPTRPETPRRRPPRCRCGSTTRCRQAPSRSRPTPLRFAARSR